METISTFHILYEFMQDGKGGVWPKKRPFCRQSALKELSIRLGCEEVIDSAVDSFLASMEFDDREKETINITWRIYVAERRALGRISGNHDSE